MYTTIWTIFGFVYVLREAIKTVMYLIFIADLWESVPRRITQEHGTYG